MNDGTAQAPPARRAADAGSRREVTFGSILAAAALAFSLAQYLVAERDEFFDHIHDLDLRLGSQEQFRESHLLTDAEWYARIVRAEQRIESCLIAAMPPEERRELNERIRQLELKVR